MNVRAATIAILVPIALGSAAAARADSAAMTPQPQVTIAVVPHGTGVLQLTEVAPGIAPGLLSAGLGQVPSGQSYLDIGQGSRLAQSLYPKAAPPIYVTDDRVPERIWRQVRARAAKAPADIVPGLLASTLEEEGVPVAALPLAGSAALIAADRSGRISRTSECPASGCPGVTVESIGLSELAGLAADFDPSGENLLIAIERPPTDRELLTVGILGQGYGEGDLTSPTTRTDGYVLATDLLPTILARYGIETPDGVTGREIGTTGGSADPSAVAAREDRLGQIRERRNGVLAFNLLIWVALVALAAALGGRRAAAAGLSALAVTMAVVPAALLLAAALAPSELVERLMVGVGAPLLAGVALLGLRPLLAELSAYGAFALAAAISVGATGIDIVGGSPFTALSLLGPNPALGVRFFGIGNELEATIGALLVLGSGAAVTALRPADPARAMAIVTTIVTVVAVLLFAPGRLGADVGAAITFPAGAAVAVIVALRLGRRRALMVLAAPIAAVGALLVIDLVTGGDAHLSRSVLGAGGLSDLGDVLQRRLTQAARSFPRYVDSPFLTATLVVIVAGLLWRERIVSWLAGRPAALAGVAGAIGATVVGTLANDSAALLLMIGTGFIAAFCGLAWAASVESVGRTAR